MRKTFTSDMSVFKPKLKANSRKLAWAIECARIMNDDWRTERLTGVHPNSYIPTEEEFNAARAAFSRRSDG